MKFLKSIIVILLLVQINAYAVSSLEQGFQAPAGDARPWVYWYWMNGNVTEEGIKADLKAMQEIGIGGVLLFDIGIHPAGPVQNRSEQWYQLVNTAVQEAAKRNIKVSFHCPGWSASGGPWVTPEMGMQELVWSEKIIKGPEQFSQALPQPHSRLGYYRDVAILAFPTVGGDDIVLKNQGIRIQGSDGKEISDACKLVDGNPDSSIQLPSTIDMVLENPAQIRSVFLRAARANGDYTADLLAWNAEKKQYEKVCRFSSTPSGPFSSHIGGTSFKAVCTDKLRLEFSGRDTVILEELEISGGYRIPNWPGKAGFGCKSVVQYSSEVLSRNDVIQHDTILDLTDKVNANGQLTWDVPAGEWTVLRIGHTPTGIHIYPAPHGGDGLECDKMSKEAADFHYDHMQTPLIQMLGKELTQKAVAFHHVDSYEAGWQNWTKNFSSEFTDRRGYDVVKYLPVVTGRVIDNSQATEEFLWDFRRTISDLFADNHYGQLAQRAHADGLGFSTEPYGGGFESLQVGGRADHPMVEFWLPTDPLKPKIAFHGVSAARTYGRPIVSAEAFTSDMRDERWNGCPADFKALGDYIYCSGVNRFVLHVCPHQPNTDPHLSPGMTCGQNGIHMDRGNTWWSQSKAWVEYMTRCQYLLQQGLHVGDVVYYQGDDAPLEIENRSPALPEGYDFDCCNTEVLLTMKVKDGRIELTNGKSYRYLVLPADGRLMMKSLKHIEHLVKQGATIIGPRTHGSPSLSEYPDCVKKIEDINTELWGTGNISISGVRNVGKGRVIWGLPFETILQKDAIEADFDYTPKDMLKIHYTHRRTDREDIYFVANASKKAGWANCYFRTVGKKPQFWYPDTGKIENCSVYSQKGNVTRIPVYFDEAGAVFVIFSDAKTVRPATHVTAVNRNGQDALKRMLPELPRLDLSNGDVSQITNNFTMSVWARPVTEIALPKQTVTGVNWADQDWAISPDPAHVIWGQGHAGSGISVGRNGICVMEHSANLVASVLVYEFDKPVRDWIHVSVVYEDGKSHLFVNGKAVKTALVTGLTIHPGMDTVSYQGYIGAVDIEPAVLNTDDLTKKVANRPDLPEITENLHPQIEFVGQLDDSVYAYVWEPGNYNVMMSDGASIRMNVSDLPKPIEIADKWTVHFPQGWNTPDWITLEKLTSLSEHPDFNIKHFSGTAVYQTTIDLPADKINPAYAYYLDLGDVAVIAELKVNGQDMGILWKRPFRREVSSLLVPGKNEIEVKVTNLWVNRLIGDEYFPDDVLRNGNGAIREWPEWLKEGQPRPSRDRLSFTAWRMWQKEDRLPNSGLLGPVRILVCQRRKLLKPSMPKSVSHQQLSEKLPNLSEKLESKQEILICAFGDSVTQGVTSMGQLDLENVYHNKLKQLLEQHYPKNIFTIINAGIGGNTSFDGLNRLQQDVLQYNPDLILIEFGLNDSGGGLGGVEHFKINIQKMINEIKANTKSDIILLTPNYMATSDNPNVYEEHRKRNWPEQFAKIQNSGILSAYALGIREIGVLNKVPIADIYTQWEGLSGKINTNTLLCNGLNHPNEDGHLLMANTIMDIISPEFELDLSFIQAKYEQEKQPMKQVKF